MKKTVRKLRSAVPNCRLFPTCFRNPQPILENLNEGQLVSLGAHTQA